MTDFGYISATAGLAGDILASLVSGIEEPYKAFNATSSSALGVELGEIYNGLLFTMRVDKAKLKMEGKDEEGD